jgi:hypothetical protein
MKPTPEEEAEYLFNRLSYYINLPTPWDRVSKLQVKYCCMFLAEKILKELHCSYNGEPVTTNGHIEFWKQVKKILEQK